MNRFTSLRDNKTAESHHDFTSRIGLMAPATLLERLGSGKIVDRMMPAPGSNRGYRHGTIFKAFMLMFHEGVQGRQAQAVKGCPAGSQPPSPEGGLDDLKESSLGRRTRSFVADRGLDDNALPDQLSKPTRLLDPDRYDTMLKTEHGDLYCRCPASGEIRSMHYQGYEKDRNTVKWACPATAYDYTCKEWDECRRLGGIRQGAKSRIARMTVDPDHLRNVNVLPPATPKWKKAYAKRSATERIFSRCDGNFMMDDLPVRGIKTVTLHITVSLTAMLAAANFAIDSGRREHIRSIVRNLVA